MSTPTVSDMRVRMPRVTTFADCPPGFFIYGHTLCLKTEYGSLEAYNRAGERFWGGVDSPEKLAQVLVLPIDIEIEAPSPGDYEFHISFAEMEMDEWK